MCDKLLEVVFFQRGEQRKCCLTRSEWVPNKSKLLLQRRDRKSVTCSAMTLTRLVLDIGLTCADQAYSWRWTLNNQYAQCLVCVLALDDMAIISYHPDQWIIWLVHCRTVVSSDWIIVKLWYLSVGHWCFFLVLWHNLNCTQICVSPAPGVLLQWVDCKLAHYRQGLSSSRF